MEDVVAATLAAARRGEIEVAGSEAATATARQAEAASVESAVGSIAAYHEAFRAVAHAAAKHTDQTLQASLNADANQHEADADGPPQASEPRVVSAADFEAVSNRAVAMADEARTRIEGLMAVAGERGAEASTLRGQLESLGASAVPRPDYDAAVARCMQLEADRSSAEAATAELSQRHQEAMAMIQRLGLRHSGDGAGDTQQQQQQQPAAPQTLATPQWLIAAVEAAEREATANAAEAGPEDKDDDNAAVAGGGGVPTPSKHRGSASSKPTAAGDELEAALDDVRSLTVENGVLAEQLAHMLVAQGGATPSASVPHSGFTASGLNTSFAGDGSLPPLLRRVELETLGIRNLRSLRPAVTGTSSYRDRGMLDGADDLVDFSALCYDDALQLVRRLQELSRLLASSSGSAGHVMFEQAHDAGNQKRHRGEALGLAAPAGGSTSHSSSGRGSGYTATFGQLDLSTIQPEGGSDPRSVPPHNGSRAMANASTLTDPCAAFDNTAIGISAMTNTADVSAFSPMRVARPSAGAGANATAALGFAHEESGRLSARASTLMGTMVDTPENVLAAWSSITEDVANAALELADQHAVAMPPSAAASVIRQQQDAADGYRKAIARLSAQVDSLRSTLRVRDATVAALQDDLSSAEALTASVPAMADIAASMAAATAGLQKAITASEAAAAAATATATSKAHEVATGELKALLESALSRLQNDHTAVESLLQRGMSAAAAAAAGGPGLNDALITSHISSGDDSAVSNGAQQASAAAQVVQLQEQLTRAGQALATERQRAIDALDRQWQLEVDASESRTAMDEMRAASATSVPLEDVKAIQAELDKARGALDAANADRDQSAAVAADCRREIDDTKAAAERDVAAAKDQLAELQRALEERAAAARQDEVTRERLRDDMVKTRQLATTQAAKLAEHEATISALRADVAAKVGEIEQMTGSLLGTAGATPELLRSIFPTADDVVAAAVARLKTVEAAHDRLQAAVHATEGQLAELHSELSDSRGEAAAAQSRAASALLDVAELRTRAESAERQLETLRSDSSESAGHLSREVARLTEERDAALRREQELTERLEVVASDPTTANVRRHGLQEAKSLIAQVAEIASREQCVVAERDAHAATIKMLEATLASTKATLSTTQHTLAQQEAAATTLQSELAAVRNAKESAETKLAAESAAIASIREQYSAVARERDTLQDESAAHERSLADVEAAKAHLEQRLSATAEALDTKTQEATSLATDVGDLRRDQQKVLRDVEQLVTDNTTLTRDRETLQDLVSDLQTKLAEARAAARNASSAGAAAGGFGGSATGFGARASQRRSFSTALRPTGGTTMSDTVTSPT